MSGNENSLENKIKYSIWDTRIDDSQREVMKKSPVLKEEPQLEGYKEKE
jgi:hypothetical protein